MTRAVGVDLGERRIGVAVSDAGGVLASPYGVVERSGDAALDRQTLAGIVAELHAEVLVVGLPLSLSGQAGRAARAAADEAAALADVVGVPVTTFDERLTTVEAARRRRERDGAGGAGRQGGRTGDRATRRAGGAFSAGARRTGRTGRTAGGRSRGAVIRSGIDAEAAAVMLGAWLEAQER
ncbi:MAG: Holliday junction resolvase RuvX [Acidimicrobiales bacterium]